MRKRLIGYGIIWAGGFLLGATVLLKRYIFCMAINIPIAMVILIVLLIAVSYAWRTYTKLIK